MKRLEIIIRDSSLKDKLLVNGKNISFEQGYESGIYLSKVDSEDEEVELSLDRFHPYLAHNWWIKEMLLFILSIFGIFGPRVGKNKKILSYIGKIPLQKDITTIRVKRVYGDKVLEVEGDEVIEMENKRYVDETLRKHRLILNLSRFLLTLFVIIICITLFVIIRIA